MEVGKEPPVTIGHRARPQTWIWRNESFIRAISMLGAYVFGVIFLISVFLVGAFAFITGALLGMLVLSIATIFVLSGLKRRRQ